MNLTGVPGEEAGLRVPLPVEQGAGLSLYTSLGPTHTRTFSLADILERNNSELRLLQASHAVPCLVLHWCSAAVLGRDPAIIDNLVANPQNPPTGSPAYPTSQH